MSDLNRHGNNAHPDLPACPYCHEWAWHTGGSYMGGFIQCGYWCGTPNCLGTADALFLATGFAVIYHRAAHEGSFEMPGEITAWLNNALKLLSGADCNGCVYSGRALPITLLMSVPVPAHDLAALTLVQDVEDRDTWRTCMPGEFVDLGGSFRAHVTAATEAAKQRGDL